MATRSPEAESSPGGPRRSVTGILEQLKAHGGLEGNLSARYSRLRERMPAAEAGQWLYYAGGSTLKRSPNAARYLGLIFRELDFPAGVVRFEGCSGQDLLQLGYPEVARKVAEMTASLMRAPQACGVICGSPRDAWMFRDVYPLWGEDLGVPVVQASVFISTLYSEGIIGMRPEDDGLLTLFHGSIGAPYWVEDLPTVIPLLEKVYSGRLLEVLDADEYAEPGDASVGWKHVTEKRIDALAARVSGAAVRRGARRIITDDPFTFEALYNHLDGAPIEVVDFCQVAQQHLRVSSAAP